MILYFKPGTCSMSPHIVLREAGLAFELVKVDTRNGKTADGADFRAINPKGYVPVLALDSGEVLTEGAVIVQYLADLAPEKALAPPAGTFERVRLQEWLTWISTELHKGFSPLFARNAPEEWKQVTRESIAAKLDWLETKVAASPFLLGERFTVADAYLFTVLGWGRYVGLELAKWPTLAAYHARIGSRPSVQAVLKAEGLLRPA